ncbi:hypothetical protein GUJ93_ZPchr0008g13589 [Zizania palustris]|uniref:Reverse transcriptase zinc-binding domain-containing protein n=1 Tax=Zizania palustris TaxID=103762 RepID=A0A8J5RJ34_ZIZPA|nr:hypothetical protein GUJ93_ZPchr0008g13589 [Zizania palustris]
MMLINSCLSSIPMYAMGVFLFPDSIHKQFDRIRSRFYWAGLGDRKKYHMVNWGTMCMPKKFGGLGFTDTKIMNISLLAKWFLRLLGGQEGACFELLRSKYDSGGSYFGKRVQKGSYFWNSLMKFRMWYQKHCVFLVGDGRRVRFWEDIWVGDFPLRVSFAPLFDICADPGVLVYEARRNDWDVGFRRSLTQSETILWDNLHELCCSVSFKGGSDSIHWALDKSGYSVKSLYNWLSFHGVGDNDLKLVWKCVAPLKVRCFLWLAMRGRIQVGEQLGKKMWAGNPHCKLCHQIESVDHLLFQCPLSKFTWCFVRDSLNWLRCLEGISDIFSVLGGGLSSQQKINLLGVYAAVFWALWINRNDYVFNGVISVNVLNVPYRVTCFFDQEIGGSVKVQGLAPCSNPSVGQCRADKRAVRRAKLSSE